MAIILKFKHVVDIEFLWHATKANLILELENIRRWKTM